MDEISEYNNLELQFTNTPYTKEYYKLITLKEKNSHDKFLKNKESEIKEKKN